MSFNTQHCLNFITKRIDFDIMAKTIKDLDPDIVGLNEMRGLGPDKDFDAQTEILSTLTGMKHYYFGKAIDVEGCGPYGNGFLSKIPVVKAETVMIPDPKEKKFGGHYETRCIIKAALENGLTVLVTHMGLNPDESELAVRTVMENIKDEKCILMGDFNLTPASPILAPIKGAMTDTASAFDGERLSFPSDKPTEKIDYIFVSKDIKVLSADIPDIVASDHRPYVAEMVI